jgi:hypothetical protein
MNKRNSLLRQSLVIALPLLLAASLHPADVANLHCEYLTDPLSIDVARLIALDKRFEYFAYPHRDHGMHEGKGTEVHLRMLIVRYLIEHLPPGPR